MITIDPQRCKGCELCIPVCPKNLISIGSALNQQGYYVASAQHMERCTGCALCAEVCPDIAITVYENDGEGMSEQARMDKTSVTGSDL